MVKRFKILLLLLGAAVLCLGFAACTALSVTDEYEAQGYTVRYRTIRTAVRLWGGTELRS